jgi:protein CpxP
MRKTTLFTAAVSCLATLTLTGTGLAQSAPATPPPAAQPTPSPSHPHQQGMDHGGQQMHDQMMQDHQSGMQKQQGQQGMPGMAGTSSGSAAANGSGMADKPASGCCEMPMKKAKPAPKPMADKPMSHM